MTFSASYVDTLDLCGDLSFPLFHSTYLKKSFRNSIDCVFPPERLCRRVSLLLSSSSECVLYLCLSVGVWVFVFECWLSRIRSPEQIHPGRRNFRHTRKHIFQVLGFPFGQITFTFQTKGCANLHFFFELCFEIAEIRETDFFFGSYTV